LNRFKHAAQENNGHLVLSEEKVPEHLRVSLPQLHEEEVIGHGSSNVVYKTNYEVKLTPRVSKEIY
jgi:hypothetical protein